MNGPIGGSGAPKLTMPSRSILDGKPYVPANSTNLKATFERVRREQARQQIPTPFDGEPQ